MDHRAVATRAGVGVDSQIRQGTSMRLRGKVKVLLPALVLVLVLSFWPHAAASGTSELKRASMQLGSSGQAFVSALMRIRPQMLRARSTPVADFRRNVTPSIRGAQLHLHSRCVHQVIVHLRVSSTAPFLMGECSSLVLLTLTSEVHSCSLVCFPCVAKAMATRSALFLCLYAGSRTYAAFIRAQV